MILSNDPNKFISNTNNVHTNTIDGNWCNVKQQVSSTHKTKLTIDYYLIGYVLKRNYGDNLFFEVLNMPFKAMLLKNRCEIFCIFFIPLCTTRMAHKPDFHLIFGIWRLFYDNVIYLIFLFKYSPLLWGTGNLWPTSFICSGLPSPLRFYSHH